MILGEDRERLERSFTEEEVFGALRAMSGDKAPGLDGFKMAFFQQCWSMVKGDVMATFGAFWCLGNLRKVSMLLFWH